MTAPTAGAVGQPQGGPPKRRLRNYLLNPRFQLKYAAIIVGVAVVLMCALGVVIMRMANSAASQAQSAVSEAVHAMQESQASSRIIGMSQLAEHADNPDLVHTIERQLADDDRQASRNVEEIQRQHTEIEQTRKLTIYSLLLTGIALVILLGIVGIVITHKVVGPVFKMKRLLREVGDGKLVITERLRRGDELEDLFDTFLSMVDSLRKAQERELNRLGAIIGELAADSPESPSVAKLRQLESEMKEALER